MRASIFLLSICFSSLVYAETALQTLFYTPAERESMDQWRTLQSADILFEFLPPPAAGEPKQRLRDLVIGYHNGMRLVRENQRIQTMPSDVSSILPDLHLPKAKVDQLEIEWHHSR